MSLRLVARSLCTLALATLFLPREARAQVDMYFQPIDPSPTQAAGLTVTVDVCGYAQTFPSLLSVSAFWNGTAVTNYSLDQVNHGCPGFYQGGTFRLTFSLTAAPGTNTLAVSVLDQNFNFFTETGDYYFGAWVTPRTGATMRASTQSAPLTLYLQNTTGGTQTYDFDLVCAPAGIIESCQMAPGSTSKTLTSGASDSVRVLANTGSAGNTGDVTVRPRINGEYADAVTIPVTLITPTMTVAEPQANVNYFPGVERTLTFQISNGATVSTNLNPLCPVSWNCYIAGGSPRNIGPSTAVDLKFTPTGTTTSNVGILAYDPLQLANRDSATVAVGILTPTVTVTQQGAQTQPYAARSNQSVVFTIGNPVTVQFNYTVTCVNVTGCPSGGQVNAGSQNVTIPFTMPSFGMTGSVTVTATQDQEPGNTASRTVTLPTTTSAFFLPGTKTITRLPGIATADTVWLKGLAAPSNPQSFTLTVQCAPAGYSCGGITPSPASPVSTADSVRAIISFTPGANGTTGTIQVEARETSLPLNLATATITVNATNAPTLTLTPASPPGATKSSYGGGPDTAKYVAKWTGSSPLTVTAFTHNCSGAVVGCQPPNHVGYPPIPADSVPVTITMPYTMASSGNGTAPLTVQAGTIQATASITVINARVRVTVRPAADSVLLTQGGSTPFVFWVRNDSSYQARYNLSRFSDGTVVGACTGVTQTGLINGGDSAQVTVTCPTLAGSPGAGYVSLRAEEVNKPGNVALGQASVKVGTYAVAVTPKTTQSIPVPPGANQTQVFQVDNTGTLMASIGLTAGAFCASPVVCTLVSPTSIANLLPNDPPVNVTVTYNSGVSGSTGGSVRLEAKVVSQPKADTGVVAVHAVAAGNIVADIAINNFDHIRPDACEASCFAARTALSTVPYISQDQPRSLTLVYNGDAVAVRPFIHADVRLAAAPATALQEYWLEAKDSTGTFITFTNGDTRLRFTAPGAAPTTTSVRLTGQFNASAYSTGVYPITLLITAKHASPTPNETKTISTKFLVVNQLKSPFGKGWGLAGHSSIKVQGTDALLSEGDGTTLYYLGCGTGCYTSPAGDFSRLSSTGSGPTLAFRREFPDSSRAEYNYVGQLLRTIDRTLTDTVAFTYDVASGRVTQVSDPFRASGTTHLYTRLAYTAAGLLDSIVAPGSNTSQAGGLGIDVTINTADSTLRQWTEPLTPVAAFTLLRYDASKRLERLINAKNDTTRIVYGASWKVDSMVSPRFGSVAGVVELKAHLRSWELASLPSTSTVGTPWAPARADTIRAITKEPGGQVTAFTVNRFGQAMVTTHLPGNPLQQVTTVTRDAHGLPLTITRHTGAVDVFTYHATNGQPTLVHAAGTQPTQISYGAFAQPVLVSGTGQPTRSFALGVRGRVDTSKVVTGTVTYVTRFLYDARQRVQTQIDPSGHQVSYTYDPVFGNLRTTTSPGTRVTTRTFDGLGRDSTIVSPQSARRTFLYDALNRVLIDSTAASGGAAATGTVFTYADKVNLTSVTDPAGRVYAFAYNRLGVDTTRTDPHNGKENTRLDAQGRAVTWQSRVPGDSVKTTYDDLHRPTQVRAYRNATLMRDNTYFYDPAGFWMAGHNAVSRDTIVNDATGWVTRVVTRLATDWNKRLVRDYIKDANDRLDSVHVNMGGTSIVATGRRYLWDTQTGVLTQARVNGQGPSLGRDGELSLAAVQWPGHPVMTLGTTSVHSPYRQRFNQPTLDAAFWRSVNVDTAGRVDVAHLSLSGVATQQSNYIYDGRSRLVSKRDTLINTTAICEGPPDPNYGGMPCGGFTKSFSYRDSLAYDLVGNPTYANTPDGVGATTLNRNRLLSWPQTGGAFSFNNDTAGRRLRRTSPTGDSTYYRWTPDGLLDTVRVRANTRRVVYEYNAFGALVRRKVGTTIASLAVDRHYVWDRENLLMELDGALGARLSEYAHFPGYDQPFALLEGATSLTATRWVQRDLLGNVVGLTNSDGSVHASQLMTDDWGRMLGAPGQRGAMGLLWKGMLYEADSTQLYYVRNRWYDPVTRRFLSEDPIGLAGGINPYTFGENDPINQSDPLGLDSRRCARIEYVDGEAICHSDDPGRANGFNTNASDRGGRIRGVFGVGGGGRAQGGGQGPIRACTADVDRFLRTPGIAAARDAVSRASLNGPRTPKRGYFGGSPMEYGIWANAARPFMQTLHTDYLPSFISPGPRPGGATSFVHNHWDNSPPSFPSGPGGVLRNDVGLANDGRTLDVVQGTDSAWLIVPGRGVYGCRMGPT